MTRQASDMDQTGTSPNLFSWNPRLPLIPGKIGRRLTPVAWRPANNFGDLLGPEIVTRLVSQTSFGISPKSGNHRLFSVGSVLHFARDGDTIWGTGRNGKISGEHHRFRKLDVRAVRGPLTAAFLKDRGIQVPDVFGDPGILTAQLFPELRPTGTDRHELTVVPNFNDYSYLRRHKNVLNPRRPIVECLSRIANSKLVVGSSLHGIIVAESFGVPARLVAPRHESDFKYRDYYLGTGRSVPVTASTVDEAIALGGAPLPEYDPNPLLEAFPYDLWR